MNNIDMCAYMAANGITGDMAADQITDWMHGDNDSFQIFENDDNHNLNAEEERYGDAPIIDVINNIGAENINKNGVLVYYIAVETHYEDDPIKGDPTNKTAVGIFEGIKLYSDSNSLPTFTNVKSPWDFGNYLSDFLMYGHKKDFIDKTSKQITEFKKTNNHWKDFIDYPPKAGDIIIIENDYKVAFEITDIDDDSFLYLGKHDYWTIMLQNWTRQMINFDLIIDRLKELDLDYILPNYDPNNVIESNNIIKNNHNVKEEDDPLILTKPPRTHDETKFDKVFGVWR